MKNDKINLLMVFSSVFDGMGICHNVFNYCKYLDRDKFNIEFVMINEPTPYFKKILDITGDKYFVLPMRNKKQIKYIFELKKILVNEKIDILHAHGNSATLALEMMAGKLAKTPIRIAHSRNSTCQHQRADKILRPLFMKTYTDAFAVSKEAGDWLFRNKPYTIIKNANDISKFLYSETNRKQWRKQFSLKEEDIAICHIGTFNQRKNQKFVVDILNELKNKSKKNYKLFFIGEGPMKDEIKYKVNALGLSSIVNFLGIVDNIEEIIHAMDIMLLPSLFEGLPNVLIEWQAACIPSIVSDTITKEAKITELPIYISLQDGASKWADVIDNLKFVDRQKISKKVQKEIQDSGFDVKINANELSDKYIDLYKEKVKR